MFCTVSLIFSEYILPITSEQCSQWPPSDGHHMGVKLDPFPARYTRLAVSKRGGWNLHRSWWHWKLLSTATSRKRARKEGELYVSSWSSLSRRKNQPTSSRTQIWSTKSWERWGSNPLCPQNCGEVWDATDGSISVCGWMCVMGL